MRFFTFLFLIFIYTSNFSQEKSYPDGHGKLVKLPLGDISFADEVIQYSPGVPFPLEEVRKPEALIGIPDAKPGYALNFLTLGTGGEVIVRFKDNALVNIEGPDLYVFEQGKYIEETFLYVSKNGKNWIAVGKIAGGNALVDIGDSTKPGDIFTYVKLVDAKTPLTKNGIVFKDTLYAGADIDAIAAIGSTLKFNLSSNVLFDVAKSVLKPQAKSDLNKICDELKKFPGARVRIEGHCDSTGSRELNRKLAKDRAKAVQQYIAGCAPNMQLSYEAQGYADEFPIAPNITPEGREKNRRVEIFVVPTQKKQ